MILRNIVIWGFLLSVVAACGTSTQQPSKLSATSEYLEWWVENQSADASLAAELTQEFSSAWSRTRTLLASDLTSAAIHETLVGEGFNSVLVGKGRNEFEFPGRSTMVLIMDREGGCDEIIYERWTSRADTTANIALVGMAKEDISGEPQVEKQIHLATFELPENGDYLDISTRSLSPLGKIILGFAVAGGLVGCDSKPTPPLAPPAVGVGNGNPQPPYTWSPFTPYPAPDANDAAKMSPWASEQIDTNRYDDTFLSRPPDPACTSKVMPPGIVVRTTGTLVGGLRYNVAKRHKGVDDPGLNGNNTTLGNTHASGHLLRAFKFQAEVTFDSLQDAFYGQMISKTVGTGTTARAVFTDDSPANIHDDLNWDLSSGETMQQFPVVEVVGNTVRWIDAPQGYARPASDRRKYVILYAGTCGRVTHVKIVAITYPRSGAATARVMTEQEFKDSVAGWTYK